MQLSERDVRVLRVLYDFRLATGEQIQRLIFVDGSPVTRARRCRSVLKRLTDHDLIGRLDRRIGGLHAGSSGFVYSLQGRGAGALARIDDTDRRRSRGEPGERFVAHVLAVTDLYVRLSEAVRVDRDHELLAFEAEPQSWRPYPAPHGGTLVIRPDAFVRLADSEYEDTFFIEQDQATESLPTIRTKLAAYIAYRRSGVEQADGGVFPKVVWIVPHERRVRAIEGVIARLPETDRQLFVVTTETDAIAALLPELTDTPISPVRGTDGHPSTNTTLKGGDHP
jgi:hypothetical protein